MAGGKSNIKRCKIACRFEIDIGRGTTESAVVFISTLDQYGLKTGSFLMSGVRLSPLILRPQTDAPTVDSTQVWSNGGMITSWGKPNCCEKQSSPLPLRPP
jgi:hypothetical protein